MVSESPTECSSACDGVLSATKFCSKTRRLDDENLHLCFVTRSPYGVFVTDISIQLLSTVVRRREVAWCFSLGSVSVFQTRAIHEISTTTFLEAVIRSISIF